ncbi:hypothetical protein ABH945_002152 [Paraburkholderia sp. GAS333]
MNRELEKTLVTSYPAIYRSLEPRYSGACRFECDDGWYRVIDELSYKLEVMAQTSELLVIEVWARLGSLRLLIRGDVTDRVGGWVAEATLLSQRSCERCGRAAMLHRRPDGRIRTLCPACATAMSYVIE